VTLTVIVAECESKPLVPVTVIVYVPIAVLCIALTLSIEASCPPGVRVTEEPLSDVFGPDVGETTAERLMVPANPFRLSRETVDSAEEPLETVIDAGLAVMLKSPTLTATMLTLTVDWLDS